VLSMSKLIQIRNVPDQVHRQLKVKAAAEGITLSELMLRMATWIAERPTEAEMAERLKKLVESSGST